MARPGKNASSGVATEAKTGVLEASKTPPEGSKMPPNGPENGSQAGLRIECRPLDALIPFARNARMHSDEQVSQIAASIKEFGFTNPILLDGENGVIAGHGRLAAARVLGLKTVPCIELGHLSEAQKRAYIIADNKLALNGGWNEELLRLVLTDLKASGYQVSARLMNAMYFGVPQSRERMIFIGIREDLWDRIQAQ